MTDLPQPVETRESRRRSGLFGLGFWLLIVFAIVCVAAGIGVAKLAPKFLPSPHAPAQRILASGLTKPLASRESPTARSAPAQQVGSPLASVEAVQLQSQRSAILALSATQLLESGQTQGPFRAGWARLDGLGPGNLEVAGLRELAGVGAPSRVALASEFPIYAAKAAAAAHAAGPGAGLWRRLQASLFRIVMIRQIDNTKRQGVDGDLARAEARLVQGDVEGAMKSLESLPTGPHSTLEPWLARARNRAEIDRRVAALQTQALASLASASGASQ